MTVSAESENFYALKWMPENMCP